MTFKDIFKKSFLEGWSNAEIDTKAILVTLAITALISLYIFIVYRLVTRKTFYSKTFNMSLCGTAIITAAIIITIQSNVVMSLGMVGALSIVRFRTAIKDPLDLMFLFWSISVGIICGAGFAETAVILSVFMTLGYFVLNAIPMAKAPMILVINSRDNTVENAVIEVVKKYSGYHQVKARNMSGDNLDLTIEVRVNDGAELVKDVNKIEGISAVSLLSHDGEVTF